MHNLKEKINPVEDGVLNYLSMEVSGALLVTGDWGCGKTYHFKNYLFPEIRKMHRVPVMVSLFGLKDVKELPEKILCAYLENIGKKKFPIGKVVASAKNAIKSVPALSKYVDVSQLLKEGEGLYYFVPAEKVVICFDDLERAIETININEILGAVNNLVENKGYKVVVIANENYIREKSEEENSGLLVFKEKVVEKTLTYVPDIVTVFKGIVYSYKDDDFSKFMSDPDVVRSVDPDGECAARYPDMKMRLSNIRMLKFAIEHFHVVFSLYKENGKDFNEDRIVCWKLKNYWCFVLGVSIEYKRNNITYDDDRGLSEYYSIVKFDAGTEATDTNKYSFAEGDGMAKVGQNKVSENAKYSENFFRHYLKRMSLEPIFHKPLYDFVTAGVKIDYQCLDKKMDEKINLKDGKINPAHELLNQFMAGFWLFKNEEIAGKLQDLLRYVRDAEYEDYASYLNASVFVYMLRDYFDANEDQMESDVKRGIDVFVERRAINFFDRRDVQMLRDRVSENVRWVADYILSRIDVKIERESKVTAVRLQNLFCTDMAAFTKEMLPGRDDFTPKYLGFSILDNFDRRVVMRRVQNMEPSDVMMLADFIEKRYVVSRIEQNAKDLPFLKAMKDGIDGIDFGKTKLSNFVIGKNLKPVIEKAIGILVSIR